MNRIIAALKRSREAGKMPLRELAPVVGVSHATLGQYETGAIDPPLSRVIAWATALGLDIKVDVAPDRRDDDGLIDAMRQASSALTADEIDALEKILRRLLSK